MVAKESEEELEEEEEVEMKEEEEEGEPEEAIPVWMLQPPTPSREDSLPAHTRAGASDTSEGARDEVLPPSATPRVPSAVEWNLIDLLPPSAPEYSEKSWKELGLGVLGEILIKETKSDYPYEHQRELISLLLEEHKTEAIIRGGTGSGKSLAFLTPGLHKLLMGELDFLLVFYPTKQLIQDQFFNLKRLLERLSQRTGKLLSCGMYCGDTGYRDGLDGARDAGARRELAALENHPPNIVLATFDKVFYQLLWSGASSGGRRSGTDQPAQESKLLQKVKQCQYLVFDEIHALRGLPAAIIKGYLKLHRQLNPEAQIVLSSATIDEVAAFKEAFLPEAAIIDCVPMRGRVEVRTASIKNILPLLKELKQDLEEHFSGKICLTFLDSKDKVEELVTTLSLELLQEEGAFDSRSIVGLHADLPPEERQETLENARAGKTTIVVATSALELGIDLPNIQTVVVCGWPVTHREGFLQRLGRLRSKPGDERIIYLLLDEDSKRDRFYQLHPEIIRKIIRDYQCNRVLFPRENPRVIASLILLQLRFGIHSYEQILQFFDSKISWKGTTAGERRTERLLAEREITKMICHCLIKKEGETLIPTADCTVTSPGASSLLLRSIRAIGPIWSLYTRDRQTGKLLFVGKLPASLVSRRALPGNILIRGRRPFLVEAFDPRRERLLVAPRVLAPRVLQEISRSYNLLAPPTIKLGAFPKKQWLGRKVEKKKKSQRQKGEKKAAAQMLLQFSGSLTVSWHPQQIIHYDFGEDGLATTEPTKRLVELSPEQAEGLAVEEQSSGLVLQLAAAFGTPGIAAQLQEQQGSTALLSVLGELLRFEAEASLHIPRSELRVAANNYELAIYDQGAGNGNAAYLFRRFDELIQKSLERLQGCRCESGCEQCFGDFSAVLPESSKQLFIKLLERMMMRG